MEINHAVQFNCSPILEWSSCELFLYIFKYGLLFNKLYRYGAYRVGCKLCPMASEWYDRYWNHIFQEVVAPDIVSTSITKSFSSDEEKQKYLQSGGWKSRIGGKELCLAATRLLKLRQKTRLNLLLLRVTINGINGWQRLALSFK